MEKWMEKMRVSNSYRDSEGSPVPGDAIFHLSETCAISMSSRYCDWGSHCMVMATTFEEAQTAQKTLEELFGRPPSLTPKGLPTFRILTVEQEEVSARTLRLKFHPVFSSGEMELSYGKQFPAWSQNLLSVFSEKNSSLSLLQGSPGTGKTTFLRWLIANAQEEADFYFVPATCIGLIANHNMTSFWIRECQHSTRPKVLIVEDAEQILMRRGPDNGHWVGNLLNITDGILSDVIRFHLVCTVNCPLSDLDPALLRPGRLSSHWVFGELSPDAAKELAVMKGMSAPSGTKPLTLADFYQAQPISNQSTAKSLGFGS